MIRMVAFKSEERRCCGNARAEHGAETARYLAAAREVGQNGEAELQRGGDLWLRCCLGTRAS